MLLYGLHSLSIIICRRLLKCIGAESLAAISRPYTVFQLANSPRTEEVNDI
jgi:hypothetical protein